MNLYLLIAFALGAITGISEVPVARPAFAAVVTKSSVRTERRASRATVAIVRRRSDAPLARTASRIAFRADAPLSGAASPRAPAL